MLRFYAGTFVTLMRDLEIVACLFSEQINKGNGNQVLGPDDRQEAIAALHNIAAIMNPLPMSRLIHINTAELERRMADDGTMTFERAAVRVKLLHDDIAKDLSSGAFFLMLSIEEAHLYEPSGSLFGEDVDARFKKSLYDIDHAMRCIALGESTAAVFHLMRAVELALHRLARGLKIAGAEGFTWGEILKHVDGALKKLENDTKTPRRDKRIEYYTQARADLAAVNGAWRKHVMHARTRYEEWEAKSIFTHVKALMQQLARDLPR